MSKDNKGNDENPFATSEGRRTEITDEQSKKIKSLYQDVSNDIDKRIEKLKYRDNISSIMRTQYLNDLNGQIQDALKSVDTSTQGIIKGNMAKMCQSVIKDNDKLLNKMGFVDIGIRQSYVPKDIVNQLVSGNLYKGDWSLSKAIWQGEARRTHELDAIIAKGIAENKTTYEIAKDLERYVNPNSYRQSNRIIYQRFKIDENGNRVPVLNSEGKPVTSSYFFGKVDYNAQRLARTMVSHAYEESFVRATRENPFIEAYQWLSTGGDRMCDICAERDGKIYQKDELPFDHPNGMCTFMIVMEKSYEEIGRDLANWVNGEGDENLNAKIDNFANELYMQGRTTIDNRLLLRSYFVNDNINNIAKSTKPTSEPLVTSGLNTNIIKGKPFKDTGILTDESVDVIDTNIVNKTQETVAKLNKKYKPIKDFLGKSGCSFVSRSEKEYGIMSAVTSVSNGKISVSNFVFSTAEKNKDIYASLDAMKAYMMKNQGKHFMVCSEKFASSYLQTHEYGHIVQNYLISINPKYNFAKCKTSEEINKLYNLACQDMFKELVSEMRANNSYLSANEWNAFWSDEVIGKQLSDYALQRVSKGIYSDVFAESFANMECGKPNEWGKAMESYLRKKGITK